MFAKGKSWSDLDYYFNIQHIVPQNVNIIIKNLVKNK
jgi:hypothetical protein